MSDKIAITISRQFCCGGAHIGQLVASRLGLYYADREVLHLAAESLGVPVEELSWRDERLASTWDRITELFTFGLPDVTYTAPPFRTVTDEHLFGLEGKIIKELAERKDCVIVGRGGRHILSDHPRAVHVFLHAPIEYRIQMAIDAYHAKDKDQALTLIQESDRMRKAYQARMAKGEWLNVVNYHLTMDTSAIPQEKTAEMIMDFTRMKTGFALPNPAPKTGD